MFARQARDPRDSRDPEDDSAGATANIPQLAYGDRVHFVAKLRPPRNFLNPGAFDYEGYLRGRGISLVSSVSTDKIEVLRGTRGTLLGFWRSRIRRSILDHIEDPKIGLWSRDDAPLFAAMVVGDDSLLLRDVREEFQKTGAYHLLVVSGMNVALLAFAVFWIAKRLRAPEWLASLVTLALSVFYACVAGMGLPIVRAVLMLAAYLGARLLYRERAAFNATGFAVAVLAVAPSALFDAGFQLTFLAVMAISGIGLPVLRQTSGPYRKALSNFDSAAFDLALEPRLAQFRLDLRLIAGRIAPLTGTRVARLMVTGSVSVVIALYELLTLSAITQAVLVLPMREYFHRAAMIGLPANILVLPLAGVMLNSAIAAIALSYVWMPLAHAAGWIAALSLHWILRCLQALSRLHVSQWRIPDATLAISLIAAAGVLLAFFAVRERRTVAIPSLALLFVSAGIVAFYPGPPVMSGGRLEITAIDVGQGDSLLVVSPEGRTLLIDGGGSVGPVRSEFDFGEDVVSPYLWSRGFDRLDAIALTHAHGDHIGGLKRVLENFHPRELWVGINPETPALDQLYAAAAANNVQVRRHAAGEIMEWGGTQVRVLSPPAGWKVRARASNDDSLALLVTYGHTSALLPGDVEKKMEKFIAGESPHADVLKVAHHGSKTSTNPELLDAVQPHYAVISAGYRNSFGHPRPEVLERLQEAHVRTYRTDTQGAITFLLDGKNVEARILMEGR